jgi:hypothetical protein
VILYAQGSGGLGLRFEMSATDASGLAVVPNNLLFSHLADVPPYQLNVANLGVQNAGIGALTLTGPGTLGRSGLWFDDKALVSVTGNVAVSPLGVIATVSENIPKGKLTPVGDFTAASGMSLEGVSRSVVGVDNARLIYRNGILYVSLVNGTVMTLR